ncbi:MAG: hypothetical protein IJO10_05830 [Clostridia bacterium]|nr:hypothetical protein [Clostridia bacterium]
MKRKILVAALLALLLTLVATSALAVCGITIGATGPDTFITCDVEGTHPYTYEYYSATQCQRYAIHSNSETGITREIPAGYVAHSFTTMNTECGYGDDNRGYTYQACKNCGYENPDYAHVPHTGFTYVPASGREPTCQVAGLGDKKCTKCGVKYILKITIPASTQYCQAGGTRVAYEATCTEKGAYESYCKWCDRSLSWAGDIPALGHDYQVEEVPCQTRGMRGYTHKVCTVCGDEDPSTGKYNAHTGVAYRDYKTAPTCVDTGIGTSYCTQCNIPLDYYAQVPATGKHTYGSIVPYNKTQHVQYCTVCSDAPKYSDHSSHRCDNYVAPTCEKEGKTEEFRCLYCLELLSGGEVIPATGHKVDSNYISKTLYCTMVSKEVHKCTNNGCSYTETWYGKYYPGHDITTGVKEATCTEDGSTTYYCANVAKGYVCDFESYTETIEATGHDQDGKVTNHDPSCCIPGSYDITCSKCGYDHGIDGVHEAWGGCPEVEVVIYEPTCLTNGKTEIRCDVNDTLIRTEYPEALDHKLKALDDAVRADCFHTGKNESFVCIRIGCPYYNQVVKGGETIPMLVHEFEPYYTKDSTCTKQGVQMLHCKYLCGTEKEGDKLPLADHLWGTKYVDKPALCFQNGYYSQKCLRSDCTAVNENMETIPMIGSHKLHNLDDHIAADCVNDGQTEGFVCTMEGCPQQNQVVQGHDKIPAKGHTSMKDCYPSYVKNATCCEDGKYNLLCGICSAEVYTNLDVSATGAHKYDWRPVGEVRCEEVYVEQLYCANTDTYLGAEKTSTRHHDWTVWGQVKAPTYTEEGLESRSCQYSNCGEEETRIIEKLAPTPSDEPNPTPTPSDEPDPTPDPSDEPDPTPDPSDEPDPTPDPSDEPDPTPDPSDEPKPTPDPSDEPNPTPDPSDKPVPTPTKNPYPIPTPVIDPDHEHEEQELKGFPPTCTEYGREDGTSCGICGETVTGGEWIAPTGHTPVVIPAVAPTETETGLTEGLKCGVCGEILRKQFIVDATGKYYDPENPDVPLDNPFAPGDIIDPSGKDVIGKVDPMGNVTDPSGKYVGTVDEEGNIIDENGNVIGKVDENGKVTDKDGNHVGDVFGYDELEGRLEPGHPNFNLSDYLDEYYSHVEGGDQIRPTIDEDKCIIGTKVKLDKDGITVLIKGAEDYAICPVDNYPMSQWIDLGNGMHKRICTCLDCDYYEIAACVYFIINVDDVEYKICPICGHFTERAYEWIKGVKVGGVGDMNELIARDIASPFGTDAVQVKDMSAEPTVITSSFTAVKSTKGVLDLWFATESLYIPMVHPGDVTMVQMNMDGEFTAVPFEYENGYVIFNADEHGLYLFVD